MTVLVLGDKIGSTSLQIFSLLAEEISRVASRIFLFGYELSTNIHKIESREEEDRTELVDLGKDGRVWAVLKETQGQDSCSQPWTPPQLPLAPREVIQSAGEMGMKMVK